MECSPSSPLLLIKVEIALQHLPQLFFLDGPEIVVFVGVDERFGEHTEQIVVVGGFAVRPELEERRVVAGACFPEHGGVLHGFEEQVVGFAHRRGVIVAPRGAGALGIEASQGVEPEGAFNGPLFFGQFSFDEFAHHRSAVRRDLLLHHLFGEERAQELGGVARPEGFFAYELE